MGTDVVFERSLALSAGVATLSHGGGGSGRLSTGMARGGGSTVFEQRQQTDSPHLLASNLANRGTVASLCNLVAAGGLLSRYRL